MVGIRTLMPFPSRGPYFKLSQGENKMRTPFRRRKSTRKERVVEALVQMIEKWAR